MAKHRAECPKTKTPLLRRGAASLTVAAMLLGGGIAAPAAFAGAQTDTSDLTTSQEVINERTMRAVVSPGEDSGYDIKFEDAQGLLIEYLGVTETSSSFNGETVGTVIYAYEVTVDEDTALTVEPVTDALQHLPATRTADVEVLPADAGKFRFNLRVTTHSDGEVELPRRTVRGTLSKDANGHLGVSFVGIPDAGLKELGKDFVSTNVPHLGIRATTTRLFYEITAEEHLAFDLDIDSSALDEMDNAPTVKVVVTSDADELGMKFYVAVTQEFSEEAEAEAEVEATEPEPEETSPAPAPEVTEPAAPAAEPAVSTPAAAPAVAAAAAEPVVTQKQDDTEEVTEEQVADEDTPVANTQSFRVSSTAPAAAPAAADDTEAPRTPATDREAGNAGSGGGDDSASDQAEVPSGSATDEVEPEAEDAEPGIEFEVGTTYSTDDELFIGNDERDELVPGEEVATEQERLADTGVNGMIGLFAGLSLLLGGAFLVIRRKFGGVSV